MLACHRALLTVLLQVETLAINATQNCLLSQPDVMFLSTRLSAPLHSQRGGARFSKTLISPLYPAVTMT